MKVLIDTNIILDYLADRAPYADNAEKIISLCGEEITGILTANAVTDVYYILRKVVGRELALEHLKLLFSVLDVADVGKNDQPRAMELDIQDFEDALAAQCARRVKAKHIITRDIQDFLNSPIPPIAPDDFLNQFFPE